ncbi:MAG: exodeoxyribonuclease VII large subunit [Desulfobacterales bacterium]|nr:exodeoxyribonuclease VII large subunit [Desulfobacterales bacterium]
MITAEKNTGHIYTVSKLTREIKSLLEETFPFIWVTGEISNYAVPGSGHSYFTLKDPQAAISAVMFKNQKRNLKFEPENGMNIMGLARLSLYEPRGSYQIIFEHLEPEGAGSIQVAFEQLKKKLSDQGLFDEKHKKAIPFLPSQISIITSGTGAAVRDIINVAQRRFSNCPLEIIPVKVQGNGSENEIRDAINLVNQFQKSDLIILARGGGSLEDLSAFNSELVANAIFDSHIPIITGVGHETDYTIADFVADLRAPTPSAAAELALPDKKNLVQRVSGLQENLTTLLNKKVALLNQTVFYLISRLKNPERVVYDLRFRLEDYESRLTGRMNHYMQLIKTKHLELDSMLQALNPEAILKRGYSISRFVSDKKVITDSSCVKKNDQIEVILSQGRLVTRVEKANG